MRLGVIASIELGSGRLDVRVAGLDEPDPDFRITEKLVTERCQVVFDARRDRWIMRTTDHPVSLQVAERCAQDLL